MLSLTAWQFWVGVFGGIACPLRIKFAFTGLCMIRQVSLEVDQMLSQRSIVAWLSELRILSWAELCGWQLLYNSVLSIPSLETIVVLYRRQIRTVTIDVECRLRSMVIIVCLWSRLAKNDSNWCNSVMIGGFWYKFQTDYYAGHYETFYLCTKRYDEGRRIKVYKECSFAERHVLPEPKQAGQRSKPPLCLLHSTQAGHCQLSQASM